MNTNNEDIKKLAGISPEELAHIGEGALAYIREIDGKDAAKMLGGRAPVPAELCVDLRARARPVAARHASVREVILTDGFAAL